MQRNLQLLEFKAYYESIDSYSDSNQGTLNLFSSASYLAQRYKACTFTAWSIKTPTSLCVTRVGYSKSEVCLGVLHTPANNRGH